MAKPKKYPEVMGLEVGPWGCHVRGSRAAVEKAVAGYGKRSNPPRAFECDESVDGPEFVFVRRLPDPELTSTP